MIIDTLPFLIQLIKQNIILQALITSGSLQNIDFKSVSYDIKSESAIEFFNFPLSDSELFDQVLFFITEDSCNGKHGKNINIILSTNDSKYFDNAEHYFGGIKINGEDINSNIRSINDTQKDLGIFQIFDNPIPPAFISIMQNPAYGYGIFVSFYCDHEEMIKRKQAIDKAFGNDSSNFSKPKKAF